MNNRLSNTEQAGANKLTEVDEARQRVRSAFREKRNELSQQAQNTAAQNLLNKAIELNLLKEAKRVALYLSFDGEINTQPLIDYLWQQNKEVYLPVLHPFTKGYLLFLRYDTNTTMQQNPFGIAEPILDVSLICPVAALDVIFTPLVAFDEQGNRMGMGGGFYDRTLQYIYERRSQHTQSSSLPLICGLAHDMQKSLALPTQVWDIPLPAILTPTTLYSF